MCVHNMHERSAKLVNNTNRLCLQFKKSARSLLHALLLLSTLLTVKKRSAQVKDSMERTVLRNCKLL